MCGACSATFVEIVSKNTMTCEAYKHTLGIFNLEKMAVVALIFLQLIDHVKKQFRYPSKKSNML